MKENIFFFFFLKNTGEKKKKRQKSQKFEIFVNSYKTLYEYCITRFFFFLIRVTLFSSSPAWGTPADTFIFFF